MPLADLPVCTLASLQQSKLYQKEQRRQFKELKELVRRHQKKTSELLRDINNKYKKAARRCSKSRWESRHFALTQSGAFAAKLRARLLRSSSSEEPDEHLRSLRDEQHQQLVALRQEQYYSQKYLQREHVKTVSPRPESSAALRGRVLGSGAQPGIWEMA